MIQIGFSGVSSALGAARGCSQGNRDAPARVGAQLVGVQLVGAELVGVQVGVELVGAQLVGVELVGH